MGFCVFGNVTIAGRYAQHVHSVHCVFIIDFDVHHGNGTNDAFYEDPDIFFPFNSPSNYLIEGVVIIGCLANDHA